MRPLIIIAGADEEALGQMAGLIREAFEASPEFDPRITSTTGNADEIVLPPGWHTTHS